jgi:hypothetical protein
MLFYSTNLARTPFAREFYPDPASDTRDVDYTPVSMLTMEEFSNPDYFLNNAENYAASYMGEFSMLFRSHCTLLIL